MISGDNIVGKRYLLQAHRFAAHFVYSTLYIYSCTILFTPVLGPSILIYAFRILK